MKNNKPTDPIALIKRINRERQLEEWKRTGFPRSKTWGGRGNKGGEDRQTTKGELRKGRFD
jgi:hypothetical protein